MPNKLPGLSYRVWDALCRNPNAFSNAPAIRAQLTKLENEAVVCPTCGRSFDYASNARACEQRH